MSKPANVLIDFALENLPTATLERQEQVYLALAELAPDGTQRTDFLREATAVRRMIEHNREHARRHAQLMLKFRAGRTQGGAV